MSVRGLAKYPEWHRPSSRSLSTPATSEVVEEVVGIEEDVVEVTLSAHEAVGARERSLLEVGGSGVLEKIGWSDGQLYRDACRCTKSNMAFSPPATFPLCRSSTWGQRYHVGVLAARRCCPRRRSSVLVLIAVTVVVDVGPWLLRHMTSVQHQC
ncbi:hypothetical protein C8R43DRAFT_1015783 [Mycena crocata]|nr:hypothetical protein C8R43DRAFT_1015727 [Mycena crocata]KAJ7143151.1 hypothetical protein C8R43DRAFT_1015763 [Mycena crocata]KAJ7143154.1 hypothetical protein C8R43DRAFT_1015783 [Mycena crocata]